MARRSTEILRRVEEQKKKEQLDRETQSVSKNLIDLYERHRGEIFDIRSRCNEIMEGPYLINPNNNYLSSGTKVAFVGQQTNGWPSSDNIAEQMQAYREGNVGEIYNSPFINIIRILEERIGVRRCSSVLLNLNRYDEGKQRPSEDNLKILEKLDPIFLEELKLIEPHIVIFFTGPDFKDRVCNLLQGAKSTVAVIDRLFKINSPILKSLVFYADHPNYLRRTRNEQRVIDAICAEVGT
ncbi:MAG: hypothetical protein V9G98_03880 [Candidatus Competibacter sp.]